MNVSISFLNATLQSKTDSGMQTVTKCVVCIHCDGLPHVAWTGFKCLHIDFQSGGWKTQTVFHVTNDSSLLSFFLSFVQLHFIFFFFITLFIPLCFFLYMYLLLFLLPPLCAAGHSGSVGTGQPLVNNIRSDSALIGGTAIATTVTLQLSSILRQNQSAKQVGVISSS